MSSSMRTSQCALKLIRRISAKSSRSNIRHHKDNSNWDRLPHSVTHGVKLHWTSMVKTNQKIRELQVARWYLGRSNKIWNWFLVRTGRILERKMCWIFWTSSKHNRWFRKETKLLYRLQETLKTVHLYPVLPRIEAEPVQIMETPLVCNSGHPRAIKNCNWLRNNTVLLIVKYPLFFNHRMWLKLATHVARVDEYQYIVIPPTYFQ